MKVLFYNIDYDFENDLNYQNQYLNENSICFWGTDKSKIYDEQIAYLNTIREVVIKFNDYDFELSEDDFADVLQDETGEYFSNFEYKVLPD